MRVDDRWRERGVLNGFRGGGGGGGREGRVRSERRGIAL